MLEDHEKCCIIKYQDWSCHGRTAVRRGTYQQVRAGTSVKPGPHVWLQSRNSRRRSKGRQRWHSLQVYLPMLKCTSVGFAVLSVCTCVIKEVKNGSGQTAVDDMIDKKEVLRYLSCYTLVIPWTPDIAECAKTDGPRSRITRSLLRRYAGGVKTDMLHQQVDMYLPSNSRYPSSRLGNTGGD